MAITKIQSESMNLADTYAFTGTVTGAGETLKPSFHAYLSANQSVATNTLTKVSLNAELWDTDSAFDSSTNYRFTVPSGEAGKYFIHYRVKTSNIDLQERIQAVVYKNGTAIWNSEGRNYSGVANEQIEAAQSYIFDLSAGDYLELYGFHNEGDTQNFFGGTSDGSWMAGYKLF